MMPQRPQIAKNEEASQATDQEPTQVGQHSRKQSAQINSGLSDVQMREPQARIRHSPLPSVLMMLPSGQFCGCEGRYGARCALTPMGPIRSSRAPAVRSARDHGRTPKGRQNTEQSASCWRRILARLISSVGACRTRATLPNARTAFDRSGAYDPDADHRLCLWAAIRAAIVSRSAGELRLSLVLQVASLSRLFYASMLNQIFGTHRVRRSQFKKRS
jgi:hypothetical protein